MNKSFEKILEKYDYAFPQSLIANMPAHPRDSAQLLAYDRKTKKTHFDTFKNLPQYLPKNSVIVFNQSKVIPARLPITKETGGKVELLYLQAADDNILVLSNKTLSVGQKLIIDKIQYLTVTKKTNGQYLLRPSFPVKHIYKVLEKYGKTPTPPYIKNIPLSERKLRAEYQTVFGKTKGSVAAPTASLHFTKTLINNLKNQGHTIAFVTLHVGLGTFAKITEEQFQKKQLHAEYFSIDKRTQKILNDAKKNKRPIIAVGTTVVRTLESASNARRRITKLNGNATLFIQEGYKFRFVNALITNFHVPKSSLMMLVSALVGRKTLLDLYKKVIARKYRLFSFGDGMLIK